MSNASKPQRVPQTFDRLLDGIEYVAAMGLVALGLGIAFSIVLIPLVILWKAFGG